MTTPSRANAVPSYCGTPPEPLTNAPPWIQTSTGSPVAAGSGVQTLRLRTSSPGTTGSGRSRSIGAGYGGLSAVGPNAVHSRTPGQAGAGAGAAKRSSPTGGAA